ncbi:MAG: FAD-dependent oxidoreductase [Hespellia sp.]|nr:FAD-dependent oxidoreductase [Hespellia sp.]
MLRINQIKVPVDASVEHIKEKVCRLLRVSGEELLQFEIVKQSIDARQKPQIFYVYTVDVALKKEEQIRKRVKGAQISVVKSKNYKISQAVPQNQEKRPVVAGSGPAGLFCTYLLALSGLKPILLERGKNVDERKKDVEAFWAGGSLNPESNVQFGEGGAGTFSDGKLNTLVKDPIGRNRFVLETFVKHGAPADILYINKPHIGTDILSEVVKGMRKEIIKMGGEVRFESCVTDIRIDKNHIQSVLVNQTEQIDTDLLILALGHSARDTFSMLYERNVPMSAKSFAVGMRVEHPQRMVNLSQYGEEAPEHLPAAAYKLAAKTESGRGVYSFCMCPGGYVVNASSEPGRIAVNGMSYHDRSGENANSAIIVTVTPEDFPSQHPLAGMQFQRQLEEKAYELGNGCIPIQCYGDYKCNKQTKTLGAISPQIKGDYQFANLRDLFPKELNQAFVEGMEQFGNKIKGFSRDDCILSGVESRTSSPVKMQRDLRCESTIGGIYPCGEGAGFAGGIMSAAMDGLKVAESIVYMYTA